MKLIPIDERFLHHALATLVSINSINPAFSDGTTSEAAAAGEVARALTGMGVSVMRYEHAPGRTNVVGKIAGSSPNGRTLMLYGHLDTVGVTGMAAPFSPEVDHGRMFGRGTYDMKGGLAACIGAAEAIIRSGTKLSGNLLIVAVADEETASEGMQEVLKHVTADAAIVTEATELDVCVAHKGFCWIEIETFGLAAHGSRYMEGVDANLHMGYVLREISRLEARLRLAPKHTLLGPPSLHAPIIKGGTGISTYSPSCIVQLERRTIPGEKADDIIRELRTMLSIIGAEVEGFRAEVRLMLERPPFETDGSSAITASVRAAASKVLERDPATIGHSYWMDAALLAGAGIDTVVIGPSGHGAHADDEYVELDSVTRLAEILAAAAVHYLR